MSAYRSILLAREVRTMFFEKLTEKAQKACRFARLEAQRMGHQHIGTEHLLLGLVREGTGVAANVLQRLGVDPKRIRLEVEKIVRDGTDVVSTGRDFTLAPMARKAFEYAFEETKRMGQNYIGTEHILLGLLRQEEGIAAQALKHLSIDHARVLSEIEQLLGPGAEARDLPAPLPWAGPAREVLDRASAKAEARGASAVAVEDLLSALLSQPRTLPQDAAQEVAALRGELDELRRRLDELGSRGSEPQG